MVPWAEDAGFATVKLNFEAEKSARRRAIIDNWDTLLTTSGNPLRPTFGEAIEAALSAEETSSHKAHLEPMLKAGEGSSRLGVAYLTAVKSPRGN